MRIIKKKTLRERASPYPNSKTAVETWVSIIEASDWNSFADLRSTFGDVDQVKLDSGKLLTIFNICGNKFRLIVAIHYDKRKVFIREFLTHHDYEKESWKLRN